MLDDLLNGRTGRDESKEEETGEKKRRRKSQAQVITGKVDAVNFSTSLATSAKDSRLSQEDITNILTTSREQAYLEWSYPGLFKDKDSEDPDKELIKCHVVFNDTFTKFKIFDVKVVTEEDDIVDDAYQVSLEDAQEYKKGAKVGDIIEIPFDTTKLDKAYVRRVKQLFLSHLKDASRQAVLAIYKDQIGGLIYGTVVSVETGGSSLGYDRKGEQRTIEVSFGKASGTLRNSGKARNRLPGDVFAKGERVCVYLSDVSDKSNPPSLVITRTSDRFVEKLREKEIPELSSGEVVIKAIAREAGIRTKVLVDSKNPNIDPVGTCIGPENSRSRAITTELHGERLDIERYKENKALQIIEARRPANVIGRTCPEDFFDPNVHYDEIENDRGYVFPKITVVVRNGNQGVAIGKAGCNVRLASKVTKCSISVLQADDAIKQGVKYRSVPEINKAIEKEFPERAASLTSSLPTATVPESTDEEGLSDEEIGLNHGQDEVVVNSDKKEVKPLSVKEDVKAENVPEKEETNDLTKEEEVKNVPNGEEAGPAEKKEEPKPEPEIVHVEIKNKPKVNLEEIEQNLGKKKGPAETRSPKRYNDFKKKNEEDKQSKASPAPSNIKGRAIYTEEELKDRQNEDQNSDNDYSDADYDEDVAEQYDSDKYYDEGK